MESKSVEGPEIQYRADIDGLRAIAVLAVIGFHARPGLIPGGIHRRRRIFCYFGRPDFEPDPKRFE